MVPFLFALSVLVQGHDLDRIAASRTSDVCESSSSTCSLTKVNPTPRPKTKGESLIALNKGELVRAENSMSVSRYRSLIQRVALRRDDLVYPNLVISPTQAPWESGIVPLASCKVVTAGIALEGANANLLRAVKRFCEADLGDQVEFFVDKRFQQVYDNASGVDGWIPEAFVTFIGLDGKSNESMTTLSAEVDLLAQSVHHFSTRPVIVANFGNQLPVEWTPERFPRMILVHARPIRGHGTHTSFNFNKIRGMLFTKVSVGLILDADQWINSGTDYMFRRAAEEGGPNYPFPIQPVHWLSRDPESSDSKLYPEGYSFHWLPQEQTLGAPIRSMRWGHAHPSWTHDALDFLAKWTVFALSDPKVESGNKTGLPAWLRSRMETSFIEDEDLLNVALWAENKTKMWCKFDIPGYADFDRYWQHQAGESRLFADSKWFPKGIPLIFFTAHDAKKPPTSFDWLHRLWNVTDDRPAILHDGKWFRSGKELSTYDPNLKCMA
eukprot:TRINITY_DN48928_c0_g1_i1.p1 TRINITY_DN48928_c0_g1~~TRINITY_DN48928_c0_g1_i1.p1  ORF type:complete len:504 (+),score=48.99 TRINITY_DN48928_c0_g1_i1:28-1512(+)